MLWPEPTNMCNNISTLLRLLRRRTISGGKPAENLGQTY